MADDPMKGDVFDPDEALNCRVETIQTARHGTLLARVAGSPTDPLILYVHGGGGSGTAYSDSQMWNGLVKALAEQATKLDVPKEQAGRSAVAETEIQVTPSTHAATGSLFF